MKIIVADDHALVREGVIHTLRNEWPDLEVIEAESGSVLISKLAENPRVDVLLLDLFMPGANGFELLEKVCNGWPDAKVVVLSASENSNHMRKAIDLGASGYIPKSLSREVMIGALRLILAGGVYIPPASLIEKSASSNNFADDEAFDPTEFKDVLPKLTERQKDVLVLLAGGRTNKEIAKALDLSEYTVKIHITAIFKALNVTNRTQAVIIARKLGVKSGPIAGY